MTAKKKLMCSSFVCRKRQIRKQAEAKQKLCSNFKQKLSRSYAVTLSAEKDKEAMAMKQKLCRKRQRSYG
jgi:hypothetical protein